MERHAHLARDHLAQLVRSRLSPRAIASRSSRACTRRMLKNSDFWLEVDPVRTIDQLRIT